MPPDTRFIVAGLSIEYAKKARGTITTHAECPDIQSSTRAEYTVTVTLHDASGEVVSRATLRTLVGPQRG